MIRGHEITLELARTRGLTELLNDLHSSQALRRKMSKAPKQFLHDRGISIPENATVTVRELEANGWEVEVQIVEGHYSYINGFNNEKGFFRIQGPQRPPKPKPA
jgi:hypothetical protein